MVKTLAAALSLLLGQSLPPLVQPYTKPAASQLSLPVSLSPNSASITVVTNPGDAGSSAQFSADTPGYMCCATAGTPLVYPATTTCINGQNMGPNAIVLTADAGNASVLTGTLISGTTVPTSAPGGAFSLCPAGVPFICYAEVANQVDGGCVQLDFTR
jgi:hypothetical protein